jgi:Tfp pilus assembly protein PilN
VRAVNLLPREAQPVRSFRGSGAAIVGGVAAAAVVAVAIGAGFMTAHSRALTEQQKLADAKLQLAHAAAVQQAAASGPAARVRQIVPVPPVTGEQKPRLAALSEALASRIAWDRVLREFSLVVPSDVTVSSLTMTAPEATPTAGSSTPASGFALTGLAYSNDSVARLLSRLQLVPDLTGVSLESSTTDPATGQVSFTVDAAVKGAATASAGAGA